MAFLIGKVPERTIETWNWTSSNASGSVCAIKAPAVLGSLVVNGGTLGTITIYNNTAASGQQIASISAPSGGQVFKYNLFASAGVSVLALAATNYTLTFDPNVS